MSDFVKLARVGDIPPGSGKTLFLGALSIALFNVDGRYFAIDNSCPHEDGPLGEGTLCGKVVTCPLHAYEFDVTSGECLTEAVYRVECYEVRVDGDDILVRLSAND